MGLWNLYLRHQPSRVVPIRTSEPRDHLANERTFLSWFRLTIVLAIVAVAVLTNFSLTPNTNDKLTPKTTLAMSVIGVILALLAISVGTFNYFRIQNDYSQQVAIVQTGTKTRTIAVIIGLFVASLNIMLLIVEY